MIMIENSRVYKNSILYGIFSNYISKEIEQSSIYKEINVFYLLLQINCVSYFSYTIDYRQ